MASQHQQSTNCNSLQPDFGISPFKLLNNPGLAEEEFNERHKPSVPAIPQQRAPVIVLEQLDQQSLLPGRIYGPPSIQTYVRAFPLSYAPPEERVQLCDGQQGLLRKFPKRRRNTIKAQGKVGGSVPGPESLQGGNGSEEEEEEEEEEEQEERSHIERGPPPSINPLDYYGKPQKRPEPWGWREPFTGQCTFRYKEYGELDHGVGFSRTELQAYFYAKAVPRSSSSWNAHAQHTWVERQVLPGEKHVHGKSRHGLTLWIGWSPAQANHRFPSWDSNKCCFYHCPAKQKFRGSQPRVSFDERMNFNGVKRDPYHVAGYMHLFCLELQFDILELVKHLDIRLDDRRFAKEDNLAGFDSREHGRLKLNTARRWLGKEWLRKEHWDAYLGKLRRERQASNDPLTREQTERPRNFNDSLTKAMMVSDVKHYSSAGKTARADRREKAVAMGKTSIDAEVHLGNLQYYQDQLDLRSCRASTKTAQKVRSSQRDDTGVMHRVYQLTHFTEGFQPKQHGRSDWDALGIPGEGFKYPVRSPNQPRIETYGPNSPHPTSGRGMEIDGHPITNIQAQLHPNTDLYAASPVVKGRLVDGIDWPVSWTPATPVARSHSNTQGVKRERDDTDQVFSQGTSSYQPVPKVQRLELLTGMDMPRELPRRYDAAPVQYVSYRTNSNTFSFNLRPRPYHEATTEHDFRVAMATYRPGGFDFNSRPSCYRERTIEEEFDWNFNVRPTGNPLSNDMPSSSGVPLFSAEELDEAFATMLPQEPHPESACLPNTVLSGGTQTTDQRDLDFGFDDLISDRDYEEDVDINDLFEEKLKLEPETEGKLKLEPGTGNTPKFEPTTEGQDRFAFKEE